MVNRIITRMYSLLTLPSQNASQILEQFTISGSKTGDNSMELILAWDQTQVSIPINY